jgi:hypothetical protein
MNSPPFPLSAESKEGEFIVINFYVLVNINEMVNNNSLNFTSLIYLHSIRGCLESQNPLTAKSAKVFRQERKDLKNNSLT